MDIVFCVRTKVHRPFNNDVKLIINDVHLLIVVAEHDYRSSSDGRCHFGCSCYRWTDAPDQRTSSSCQAGNSSSTNHKHRVLCLSCLEQVLVVKSSDLTKDHIQADGHGRALLQAP